MPYKDTEKQRAAAKAYREKNKEAIRKKRKERYNAAKKHLVELKSRGCSVCGECLPPSAMDFHHIDPNTKANNGKKSDGAIEINWSIARINKEVEKCILVCANCHRIIHASVEELLEFNIRQTTETQRDSSGIR